MKYEKQNKLGKKQYYQHELLQYFRLSTNI